MSAETLLDPVPVFRIGRGRTTHRARVLIEDGRVVVRSRCGLLRDVGQGFTETLGFPTCEKCRGADQ